MLNFLPFSQVNPMYVLLTLLSPRPQLPQFLACLQDTRRVLGGRMQDQEEGGQLSLVTEVGLPFHLQIFKK